MLPAGVEAVDLPALWVEALADGRAGTAVTGLVLDRTDFNGKSLHPRVTLERHRLARLQPTNSLLGWRRRLHFGPPTADRQRQKPLRLRRWQASLLFRQHVQVVPRKHLRPVQVQRCRLDRCRARHFRRRPCRSDEWQVHASSQWSAVKLTIDSVNRREVAEAEAVLEAATARAIVAATEQAERCGGLEVSGLPANRTTFSTVYTVDPADPTANGRPHYSNADRCEGKSLDWSPPFSSSAAHSSPSSPSSPSPSPSFSSSLHTPIIVAALACTRQHRSTEPLSAKPSNKHLYYYSETVKWFLSNSYDPTRSSAVVRNNHVIRSPRSAVTDLTLLSQFGQRSCVAERFCFCCLVCVVLQAWTTVAGQVPTGPGVMWSVHSEDQWAEHELLVTECSHERVAVVAAEAAAAQEVAVMAAVAQAERCGGLLVSGMPAARSTFNGVYQRDAAAPLSNGRLHYSSAATGKHIYYFAGSMKWFLSNAHNPDQSSAMAWFDTRGGLPTGTDGPAGWNVHAEGGWSVVQLTIEETSEEQARAAVELERAAMEDSVLAAWSATETTPSPTLARR